METQRDLKRVDWSVVWWGKLQAAERVGMRVVSMVAWKDGSVVVYLAGWKELVMVQLLAVH